MAEVNWTDGAIDDIGHIADTISRDSARNASAMVERFLSLEAYAARWPVAGHIVHEVSRTDVRELRMGNYRIIYLVRADERIDILTVIHSKRRLSVAFIRKRISRRRS